MQTMDTSLAVIEITSLAVGYQVLAAILRSVEEENLDPDQSKTQLRALEGTAIGPERFLIVLQGSISRLEASMAEAVRLCEGQRQDLLLDREIFQNPHQDFAPAMYSLSQNVLDESLIVVETQTVTGLLSATEILLGWEGIQVIDLKPGRGLQGKGLGFFTGKTKAIQPAAEAARMKLKNALREGRIEVIESPSQDFREFFQ